MRQWFSKKPVQYALAAFVTLAALMLFWYLLDSSDDLGKLFQKALNALGKVLSPFFWALILSYLLGRPVDELEKLLRRLFPKAGEAVWVRLLAQGIAYIFMAGMVVLLLLTMVPRLINDMVALLREDYLNTLLEQCQSRVSTLPQLLQDPAQTAFLQLQQYFVSRVESWENTMLPTLLAAAKNLGKGLTNFALAAVFSFYLLYGAKPIFSGWKRFITGRFGKKRAEWFFIGTRSVDRVFGRYLSAKLLESVVIFALCQAAFLLMRMPYGTIIAIAVAVANVVPFAGPLAGFALAVVVAAFESPAMAAITAVFLLALRLFDDLWLSPRIVGCYCVLHPFWNLAAVLVGAYVGGILGMFLSVPVAASCTVIYRRWNGLHENKQGETKE